MEDRVVIDNFEPFNELFYKTCFYNSLFPIIKHYQREIFPILINDVSLYGEVIEKDKLDFNIKYLPNKNICDLLMHIGIKLKSYKKKDNLVEEIKNSIEQKMPVIIRIDCFLEPFRRDAYMKKHIPHTLLIYGYDECNRQFNIIEHKNKDTLSYEKKTIKYEDLINAYEAYFDNFGVFNPPPSYYEFQLINQQSSSSKHYTTKDYTECFIENIKLHKEAILNGLDNLNNFSNKVYEITQNETELLENIDTLINIFNLIINCKEIEMYKITKLFGKEHELFRLLTKNIENANLVRSAIARYKYSNIYKKEVIELTINKFKNNYDLENKYYKYLFELL